LLDPTAQIDQATDEGTSGRGIPTYGTVKFNYQLAITCAC